MVSIIGIYSMSIMWDIKLSQIVVYQLLRLCYVFT